MVNENYSRKHYRKFKDSSFCVIYPDLFKKDNLLNKTWRKIIGTPIASSQEMNQRLDKVRALAIFSSDAISSVAYGPEQVLLILMMAGTTAMIYGIPITFAVVVLVVIVAISYRQTIYAYPTGGGSFIVARENLGTIAGLTAASALLIDYVLTVAVSISAGVSAIVSVFPEFNEIRVIICIISILILIVANFRGLKDSGAIFALPTYVFIFSVLGMLIVGFVRIFFFNQHLIVQNVHPSVTITETLSLWLILRAFSSGAATLTGIEAVADGVPSFKPHEAKNAAITLGIMSGLLATMALGIAILAHFIQAIPSDTETILSQVGRTVFGNITLPYYILQISTTLILILAAQTAFADFPRLSSILARYKFMPHQLAFRGDRLAFSTGIAILGILAGVLVIGFGGNERHLIPLYAVGVFLSFTLSQTGMICRWWKLRTPGWKKNILVNTIGAVTTFVVLVIIISTKFTQGAWTVVIVIPLIVLIMRSIQRHYTEVERQLHVVRYKPQKYEHKFIIPVSKVDKHSLFAVDYALSITQPTNIIVVHVSEDRFQQKTKKIQREWNKLMPDISLTIIESPFRQLIKPLLVFIENVKKIFGQPVTVVIADYQPIHWWEHILHTHTSLRLKAALSKKAGIVIINTHYKIHKNTEKALVKKKM
jgi:amino acid transporter